MTGNDPAASPEFKLATPGAEAKNAVECAREYASSLADASFTWYRKAAIRSRRAHRASEILIIACAAATPISAVLASGNTVTPAILGSLVVLITGLKNIFRWQENYLRFSRSREAIEAERRSFTIASAPYDRPEISAQLLTNAVTRIEQDEMAGWMKVVNQKSEG